MKLHFGFESIPYSGKKSPLGLKRGTRGHRAYGAGKNTQQVAAELEERYRIVETFYSLEEENIVEMLEDAYAEEIEEVMQSKLTKRTRGVSTEDTDKIEQDFRSSIDAERYNGMIPGVPTLAAQRGVSHLLSQPYSRQNPRRPSFKDTGLYQRSFRAWVELDEED